MPLARRTDTAERDLRNIAFHIAVTDKRPITADRIIDELIEQCETLARLSTTARLGTEAPEIGDGVRFFTFKRWGDFVSLPIARGRYSPLRGRIPRRGRIPDGRIPDSLLYWAIYVKQERVNCLLERLTFPAK